MRYASSFRVASQLFVNVTGRIHAKMRSRYSEFDDLRQRLESAFPHARNALPALPPKSVLCMFLHLLSPPFHPSHPKVQANNIQVKFRPKFLESRRIGLEYFLKYALSFPSPFQRQRQYSIPMMMIQLTPGI